MQNFQRAQVHTVNMLTYDCSYINVGCNSVAHECLHYARTLLMHVLCCVRVNTNDNAMRYVAEKVASDKRDIKT